MALQPFNYFFFQCAGSITVNGSPPASSYNDGDVLTIDVTFLDGNTAVQWIVNNADEGTTDPLVYVMPIGGAYIRILGSGAPVVTNEFRFFWRFVNGIGTLLVNGVTPSPYYEAGTSLTISVSFVSGYTFNYFDVNNGLVTSFSNPFVYTMPSQDVDINVYGSGVFTPTDTHGLRYFAEFCDITGQQLELEILEEGYVGYPEQRKCAGVSYSFGDFGGDVLDVVVPSSISFSLIGLRDEFFELLDGGNRFWKVRLNINSVLFWEGYISNQFLTVNEIGTVEQTQRFTAVDGTKSLYSIRAIDSYFTRITSGFEMMTAIVNCMNQTFDNARTSHVGCSIYETRLDRNVGIFQQLLVPDNAVYENGEVPIFITAGNVALNTSLFIGEILERMLTPFLCRLFLWKNEFYIISTPELNKSGYIQFDYNELGEATGGSSIVSGLDLSCKFTDGQRTGKPVYTEFTNVLKFGVLDVAARGGMIEFDFGNEDWILLGTTSPYIGSYQLKNWKYVFARPSNRPDSYPTGTNLALVQFVDSGYCKIWGTTSSSGIADPNTSWIEIDTYRNQNPIQVAQGIANTLAFKVEFITEGRSSTEPIPVNQFCGVMIRVGSSYMEWDGNQTFSWTLTETVMEFPMLNKNSWNVIDIVPITIPEDGIVTIRLYETINNGSTADRYTVGFKNMSLKIEQNASFTKQDIRDKFITSTKFSNVYPDVVTHIGDVGTDNSSSAIKLNIPEYNYPHSSLWSIDGTTEIKLAQVMLQEIANLQGQRNPRLIATALRDGVNPLEVVPYQNVIYDGYYWMVLAIDLDFKLNTWRIELHQLGLIAS